jgi:phosphocarrier protein
METDRMKEFHFTVSDPNGMHARPAGALVACAKGFPCTVRVQCGEKEVDAKRLLSLMSLGARCGTLLTVRVSGEREEEAARALEELCRTQLGRPAPKEG